MENNSNPKLTPFAKELRRNMTEAERKLWYQFLKQLPVTVNRQKVIGNYIVDFYIHSSKIVIELDGEQHGEPENLARDAVRDQWLREQGLTVLRYSNYDVYRYFEDVCQDILRNLPEMLHDRMEGRTGRGEAFASSNTYTGNIIDNAK